MACACQSNKKKATTYVATFPSGEQKAYQSEVEAKAAVQRAGGGSVKAGAK